MNGLQSTYGTRKKYLVTTAGAEFVKLHFELACLHQISNTLSFLNENSNCAIFSLFLINLCNATELILCTTLQSLDAAGGVPLIQAVPERLL